MVQVDSCAVKNAVLNLQPQRCGVAQIAGESRLRGREGVKGSEDSPSEAKRYWW